MAGSAPVSRRNDATPTPVQVPARVRYPQGAQSGARLSTDWTYGDEMRTSLWTAKTGRIGAMPAPGEHPPSQKPDPVVVSDLEQLLQLGQFFERVLHVLFLQRGAKAVQEFVDLLFLI